MEAFLYRVQLSLIISECCVDEHRDRDRKDEKSRKHSHSSNEGSPFAAASVSSSKQRISSPHESWEPEEEVTKNGRSPSHHHGHVGGEEAGSV